MLANWCVGQETIMLLGTRVSVVVKVPNTNVVALGQDPVFLLRGDCPKSALGAQGFQSLCFSGCSFANPPHSSCHLSRRMGPTSRGPDLAWVVDHEYSLNSLHRCL
jgi:hypothetical protein